MQPVSVSVPRSLSRPPPSIVSTGCRATWRIYLPPIVIPEIDAVTSASTWNTRLAPPALTVTPGLRAHDRLRPGRVAQLELAEGRVEADRLRRLEHRFVKGDRLVPPVRIRLAIAWRRSIWPTTGVSVGLFTTIVEAFEEDKGFTPGVDGSIGADAFAIG